MQTCPCCDSRTSGDRCRRCSYRLGERQPEEDPLDAVPWLSLVREEGARGYRDHASRGLLRLRYRWLEGLHVFHFLGVGLSAMFIWVAWRSGLELGLDGSRFVGISVLTAMLGTPVYVFVAKWVNSTVVTVDRDTLRVRHRPLPWTRPDDIPLRRIRRLFTTVKPERRGRMLDFRVHVRFRNGEERLLLSGFPDAPSAQAVEDMLAAHLGLAEE